MVKRKAGADNPFVPKHENDAYLVSAFLMSEIYEHVDAVRMKIAHPKDTKHLLDKMKKFANGISSVGPGGAKS
jgi:hypothetical protein